MKGSTKTRSAAACTVVLGFLIACGSSTKPPTSGDSLDGDGGALDGATGANDDAGGSSSSSGGVDASGGTSSGGIVGPDGGIVGPRPKTDAGNGDGGSFSCTKLSPTDACQGKCGDVSDGCNGSIPCGATCTTGQICNATTNACRIPRAGCEELGVGCGIVKDDCGNDVNCGNCPDTAGGVKRECDQSTFQCVACPANLTPASTDQCLLAGYQCGTLNRCGVSINCGSCPGTQVCDAVNKICITPFDAACNGRCGTVSNGKGGVLDCGGCPSGQACGVGGVQNVCAPSRPGECVALGIECGPLKSQCGGAAAPTLNCGSCTNGLVCRANGTCGPPCQPKKCDEVGAQCGFTSDGCGKQLNCGPCPNGGACNPNTNQCCQPLTCAAYPNQCGAFSNGCGGSITCNPCGGGQTCIPGGGCCTPKSCGDFPGQCGNIQNGCGGVISCGCGGGNSCVGGLCQACTPRTCQANYPGQCGTFSNGCGGSISCSCPGGQKCGGGGIAGQCGCLDTKSCPQGFVGPLETCYGVIFCGT